MRSPLRTGYSRMVLDDHIRRVSSVLADRAKRLAAVRTRRDAERYCAGARAAIARVFGSFPERTPLKARLSGAIEKRDFRIEKIFWESRPQCLVTANLYVPQGLRARAPGILANCQHAQAGKADVESQSYAQELARSGFVVLVFDPLAQGERDQFSEFPKSDLLRTSCAEAHNMMGKQLQLTGEFLGTWMVWDAMRALDYLAGRSEVDPARLGVTGNSGGGAMSSWLWALDDRLAAAAPSCFATSLLSNIENELPSDAEQLPPRLLAEGLDHADLYAARAPEPTLLISQRYDFFDHRGAARAAEEVGHLYGLLGTRKDFQWFLGGHPHGYFPDGRMAMRRFFCDQFGRPYRSRVRVALHEPPALKVTTHRQVQAAGGKAVPALNADLLQGLKQRRGRLAGVELSRRVVQALQLSERLGRPVPYRNLRSIRLKSKALVGRYAVRTEEGIEAILFKAIPPKLGPVQTLAVEKHVRLHVPHWACETEFLEHATSEPPSYGVDLRGMGESLCNTIDVSRTRADGHEWMEYLSQGFESMLGRSFLGRRVYDLLVVCDLLAQEGAREIHLIARGQGALIGALAMLFRPGIRRADLHDAPISFEEWVKAPKLAWPYANCPPGVLNLFDLPDVYRSIRRRAVVHSHWDAQTCPRPFR